MPNVFIFSLSLSLSPESLTEEPRAGTMLAEALLGNVLAARGCSGWEMPKSIEVSVKDRDVPL